MYNYYGDYMKLFGKNIKFKNLSNLLIFLPFLIPFALFAGKYLYDNDFWFTINQGRYILNNGFPTTVISTIHEGLSFVYQSWGTGVLFYSVYHYLGNYGMLFLMIITLELIVYFYYKLCVLVSNNNYKSIILTTLLMLIFGLYTFPRPHMFTVLNLILILYCLEKYIRSDNKKNLIPIPFLFLLEVNMHGIYFVPLLVIITPYLINSFKFNFKFLNQGPVNYHKKPLFITYLISILVGFINPYTYKIFTYGFSSYGNEVLRKNINEMGAINFHDFFGKICIITLIVTFITFFANKSKKIPLRYYLLLLGTAILALDAYKSFYIFLVCSFFGIAYIMRIDEKKEILKKEKLINLFIVLLIGGLIITTTKFTTPKLNEPANFLQENKKIDNPSVYTSFGNGSYFEYRGFNCYIDPRAEVFLKSNNKKEDILDEYFDMQHGVISIKDFLDKYNFDYLLLQIDNDAIYTYIKDNNDINYNKVYDDEKYQIWERNDIKEKD